MIVLPSRARPHNFRRLISACRETGTTTSAYVRLDEDDATLNEYLIAEKPSNWIIVVGERLPLSGVYNEVYRSLPDAAYWIFIADDVVPLTHEWDRKLIEAAGTDGMAVPSGGHEDYAGAPHFALGGDLARSMGWLALPGLNRLYIDTVWWEIAEAKGVLRHAPDIVLDHRHFSNGKALMDSTYRKPLKAEDKAIYETWKQRGYTKLKGETHGNPT